MSTDTPDLFRYAQSSVFTVKFLGHLGNEQGQRGAESRQWEVLEIIDAAQVRNTPPFVQNSCRLSRNVHYMIVTSAMNFSLQRQGRLPWVTSDQDQRILSLSKYGIKVTDENRQRVYARHALHFIINITYYEDTYSKHMIAIRVGRPNVATFDLYVYECTNEVSGCHHVHRLLPQLS